jgi:hypothetical protein
VAGVTDCAIVFMGMLCAIIVEVRSGGDLNAKECQEHAKSNCGSPKRTRFCHADGLLRVSGHS